MAPQDLAFAPCVALRARGHATRCSRTTPSTRACLPQPPPPRRALALSRRAALAAAAAALAGVSARARAIELYKTGQTRYIPQGRPKPSGPPPAFDAAADTFTVRSVTLGDAPDTLEAQDVAAGRGEESVERGSLVVARWTIFLADGSVVEESDPEMFRVGVAQVYPGLDAALIGMKPGGVRKCRGPAPAFFSDITNGERSLVPSDAEVYATIEMRKLNPFGK